jgi:hypothetical protein
MRFLPSWLFPFAISQSTADKSSRRS